MGEGLTQTYHSGEEGKGLWKGGGGGEAWQLSVMDLRPQVGVKPEWKYSDLVRHGVVGTYHIKGAFQHRFECEVKPKSKHFFPLRAAMAFSEHRSITVIYTLTHTLL